MSKLLKRIFYKENNGGDNQLNLGLILGISILLVIVIWSTTFIIISIKDTSNSGLIGDSFGMVNALFSALAFSLLIYTSLLQTQELKLQRKELEENRKQLEASAKAHQELVELTKTINHDKIHPSLKLHKFLLVENYYVMSFVVNGAALYWKNVKLGRHVDKDLKPFGFSYGPEALVLNKENSIIEGFQFPSKYITKEESTLTLYFESAFGNTYYQEMKVENGQGYLGSSTKYNPSKTMFI